MLFEHCASCRSCCHVDAGFPPLEVTLTRQEKTTHGKLCIEDECRHLGQTGCSLGEAKPLSCQLYPLAFNPGTRAFYFDADCPLMPEYQRQLHDPRSAASVHLAQMSAALNQLAKTEPAYLRKNFQIDTDYFDLLPLASHVPGNTV